MAIRLDDKYPGRVNPADPSYPDGSVKNETVPNSSNDGTPLDELWGNDIEGLKQAVLRSSGIAANDVPDTALTSQVLQGLMEIASGRAIYYNESGIADAYVLDARANQQSPAGYFDGMTVQFIAGNDNTGASTINVAALGIKDLKKSDGDALDAGYIVAGEIYMFRYNGTEFLDETRFSALVTKTTGEKTWNVATTGSDTTGDGSAGLPFATPQKAWESIPDIALHMQIMQLADGTYDTSSIAAVDQPRPAIIWGKGKVTPIRSFGSGANIEAMISIRGNAVTPGNVILETGADFTYGIYINKGNVGIQDLTIRGDGVNPAQSLLVAHRTDTFVHAKNVFIDGGAAGAVIGAIVESTGSMEFIAGEIKNCDIGGAALAAGDQLVFASQGDNQINNCTTGVSATYGGYIALNMLQNGQGQVEVIDGTCVTGALLSGNSILKVRGQDHGTDTCQINASGSAIECESSHVDLIFAETLAVVNLYAGSTIKVNSSNYQDAINAHASDVHLKTSNSYVGVATENDALRPVALTDGSRIYQTGTNNINGSGGTVTVPSRVPATATFTANNQGYTLLDGRDYVNAQSDSGNSWTGCYVDSTGITEGRTMYVYGGESVDGVELASTSGHMDLANPIIIGNAVGEYRGATFTMLNSKWRLTGLGQLRV